MNENKSLLFKVASIYTSSIDDRNDLTQEILYQLWKSFTSFNYQSGLTTWMYKVAMNTSINYLKSNKRRVNTVPLDEHLCRFQETNKSETEGQWKLLKQHIDNLNLMDKGIVLLYMENKSYEEMASITGISKTNIATKLSRIKDKLRNQISKEL